MAQRVVQVDSFTMEPFRGNPAAVCVMDREHADAWMAAVAAEMNLSETAFLRRTGESWSLRWFTPVCEVDLCGHATLAAAHVLWEDGLAPAAAALRFDTLSGQLHARRAGDGAIILDFPAEPARPMATPPSLLAALGIAEAVAVARNRMDYLVQLDSAAQVRTAQPDFAALARLDARGFIVTAEADDGIHDFVSRFFGPAVGVDEDPVTGSAHCCLGPWWAARLGRAELRGYQASRRGGTVGVHVRGDRIDLVGHAITVMRGEIIG